MTHAHPARAMPVWRSWWPIRTLDWRTFVSALLIVAAFPPWDLWPLIWICLIPWFAALERAKSYRESIRQGIWLSVFMSLGGFYWVAYVLEEFGNLPRFLSVLGLLAFSVFGQPQFPVYAFLSRACSKLTKDRLNLKGTFFVLLLGLLYAGIDWAIPKLFVDTLGHSLYRARSLRQLADLGSPILLTWLIFLVNDTIWSLWKALREKKRPIHLHQVAVVSLMVFAGWLYGNYRTEYVQKITQTSTRGVQVAAVQGNIGDFDKVAAERGIVGAAIKVLDTFISMTDKALETQPKPHFVVWPETSFPSTYGTPHSSLEMHLDERVSKFVTQMGIPLLFGGYDHFQSKDFNALFLLTPDKQVQVYRKNILLLFGEYIPGADWFPWIKSAFPQVGNFGRGSGPEVLAIPVAGSEIVHAGPIICYEALFPNYLIQSARNGSELILNITNDSWFGAWGEPQLHLALTAFRSIETRLPMLRTTNTGISAIIQPDGEITSATAIGVPTVMNGYIALPPSIPTLMKAWGDWFGPTALALSILGLFALNLRKRKKGHIH